MPLQRRIIKMLSYKSIMEQDLYLSEVDLLIRALFRRGKLIIKEKDEDGVMHIFWTGAVDSNCPAYPCSTSVKVSCD
jgi:hypothetical protein